MYWLGLGETDVHQNISSPGWAKHAWSCFFAPWNAGATVLAHEGPRFSPRPPRAGLVRRGPRFRARASVGVLRPEEVTPLRAPPTVWPMVTLEPLGDRPPR